ncbi:SDR family oxidoreductase [Viridibacillus sp. YIM B01967]|uniref:SDR family oxidoreductase n=1 Tax=Viridibacillus soli TaxID=2798301 RepID=A0ABS1H7Q6_9BACL|nr:SDR family oxidoreductase [Viridibacillus soli]MBK3495351.1 SDR family oxidoreductase [Viridibacillus soli]
MTTGFFTGFPGFIASQIIRTAFNQGKYDKVYAVVLITEKERAEAEAERILRDFPDKEIGIIVGDITLTNLAINDDRLERLLNDVDVVWHLAAIYDLAVPKDVAWRVNVQGTKMVNAVVSKMKNLKRYMYFSTAYVAGTREGILLETELIRPKTFKNFYEETKYEAEILVDQLKSTIPITIIRPGIVRGNSQTGETVKFDGPYFFLNMIDRLKRFPFIPYIGQSKARLNVVPIDYITDGVVYLSVLEAAIGQTVHLTDPNPHPVQEVYRAMVHEVTGHKPRGRIPISLARKSMSILPVRKALGVEYETLDYLTWSAVFDTTVAKQLLAGSSIECADFIQSMPAMIEFYDEHKSNKTFHIQIK